MEEILYLLTRLEKKVDSLGDTLNSSPKQEKSGIIKKIDSLGRVTIPITFRRILQIEDNEELEISLSNNQIIITKL